MKKVFIFVVLILLASSGYGVCQNPPPTLASSLSTHHFTFKPQSVTPMRGTSKTLYLDYTVRVTADSLIAFLPYFGSQYTIPSPTEQIEGGYKFSTTHFTYTVKSGRRKGWDILITATTDRDVRQLAFNASRNGWTTLTITSAGRDPITYYGTLTP